MGVVTGASVFLPWNRVTGRLGAAPAAAGLSDPSLQPKFVTTVPDALAPGFKLVPDDTNRGRFRVAAGPSVQQTGLVNEAGVPLNTPVFGYGEPGSFYSWPGRTFEVRSNEPVEVEWENQLVDESGRPVPHLLPVDTSLHWAYSLRGYQQHSIEETGVPIVTHLHGGRSDSNADGIPEHFFSPDHVVRGPRWVGANYLYQNDQPAGALWYHDHALGITRLNVYAGLAGFYIIRDDVDTGLPGNPLDVPAWPYEAVFARRSMAGIRLGRRRRVSRLPEKRFRRWPVADLQRIRLPAQVESRRTRAILRHLRRGRAHGGRDRRHRRYPGHRHARAALSGSFETAN